MGRAVPEGIRITKVGLWYVLFTLLVGVAATNTGNNALYLVLALMLGLLATSGLLSRRNLRALDIEVEPPSEIVAERPFRLRFTLRNRRRFLPRWLLLFSVGASGEPALVGFLPPRGRAAGGVRMTLPRRGRRRLGPAHVASLFPLGLFYKGLRYELSREVLVFPALRPFTPAPVEETGGGEAEARGRAGRGHELFALRGFREGDDPRGVHWKQTARTGSLVFVEHEAETDRRVSVVFDNGTGPLAPGDAERFERLVSEAASLVVSYLDRGHQVALRTRERVLPFGAGRTHRHRLLETLALVEPCPQGGRPLGPDDPTAPCVCLRLAGSGSRVA